MIRSSKRYSPSVPGSPGCAKRGVWWRAVAKFRLPSPPRPPLHKTNCWPCVVRSATSSPLRSEEHTSELQSLRHLVCRLLLEKKKILLQICKSHGALIKLARPAIYIIQNKYIKSLESL